MAAGLKDRIPPHDDEAEKAVLGALLLDSEAVGTAVQYLRGDDFYSNANGKIFEAIVNLSDRGTKPDILTVAGQLRQEGKLDEAGGPDYVASLTSIVPTSANIEYYAQTVQSYSLRRALLRIAGEIGNRVFDETLESRIILEETQQRIFDLSDKGKVFTFKTAKEIVSEAIKEIESLYNSKKEFTGLVSGFGDLDKISSGFKPSEFIIIGARPSMGKTAIALNMAAHMSVKNKIPAAFFTLEMSGMSLIQRIISSEAEIESNALRTGYLKLSDMQKLMVAAGNIYEAPLFIVDMPNMRLLDLRSQARRLRANQKIEIIFIDYITLISMENTRLQPHEQIAEISRSLKSLARELNIPIVALSQLTRDAEKDRPNLANIRASGAIEQDADMVLFLHRERDNNNKDGKNEAQDDKIKTELKMAKNRNGPVGTIKLMFLPKYAKFVSMTKENYI
jgi:replicative DNA helicase